MAEEKEVGYVEHWFGHINVAGIKVTNGPIKVGDTLHYNGHTTDFQETVGSMQMEHGPVTEVKTGDDVGIKVSDKARVHDKVFLINS